MILRIVLVPMKHSWRVTSLAALLCCLSRAAFAQPAIAPVPAAMKPDWSITIQVPVRLTNFDPRAAFYLPIECTIKSTEPRSATVYVPLEGGRFDGTVDVRIDMGSSSNFANASSFYCVLHSYSPRPQDGLPQDIAQFDKTKPLRTSVSGAIPRAN